MMAANLITFEKLVNETGTSRFMPKRRRGRPKKVVASQNECADGGSRRMRRCTCGTCARCADNARWERIFREKFADPAYYADRPIRSQSPLHV